MSQDIQAQVKQLQAIALERYEQDGGSMCECMSAAELEEMILEQGGVEEAWAFNVQIVEAQRESGGYYERF